MPIYTYQIIYKQRTLAQKTQISVACEAPFFNKRLTFLRNSTEQRKKYVLEYEINNNKNYYIRT